MATLLPPPKRVKVYHGIPEPEPELPKASPNIVVQFVSEENGEPLAPAVNLPANVSREGLEALLNKLNTQVNFRDVSPAIGRLLEMSNLISLVGRRACTLLVPYITTGRCGHTRR